MPPHVAEMLGLMSLFTVGGTLVALRMFLRHRLEMTKAQGAGLESGEEVVEELRALRDDIALLRSEIGDSVEDLHERVGELSGRVEFAERLLAKPKGDA